MVQLAGRRCWLATHVLAYFLSITMIYQMSPFFQPYAADCCGATPDDVGFIFAALPFSAFLGSLVLSDFLGWLGARAGLAAGLLVLAASTTGFGLTRSLGGWFLWRVCQGVSHAAVNICISTALAQGFRGDGEFAFIVSIQEMWGNFGFSVGPVFGALLYKWGGFLAPFGVSAIGHVVLVAVSYCPSSSAAPPGGDPLLEDSEQPPELPEELVSWREVASFKGELLLTGAAALAIGSWGCIEPSLVVHFEASLGITTGAQVGLLFGIPALFAVAGSAVTVKLMEWMGGVAVSVLGLVQLSMGCALLALTDPTADLLVPQPTGPPAPLGIPIGHPVMWACTYGGMILVNIGYALAWTPILPLMMDVAAARTDGQGRDAANGVSSIFNAAVAIGEACGPIIGGLMADLHGFAGTSMSPAVVSLLYAGALAVFAGRLDIPERSMTASSLDTPRGSVTSVPYQARQRSSLSLPRSSSCSSIGRGPSRDLSCSSLGRLSSRDLTGKAKAALLL